VGERRRFGRALQAADELIPFANRGVHFALQGADGPVPVGNLVLELRLETLDQAAALVDLPVKGLGSFLAGRPPPVVLPGPCLVRRPVRPRFQHRDDPREATAETVVGVLRRQGVTGVPAPGGVKCRFRRESRRIAGEEKLQAAKVDAGSR
jgi:hypothetical protein